MYLSQTLDLPVAEEMNVLGVVLDHRLTFDSHVTAVATWQGRATTTPKPSRHIRHLLTTRDYSTPTSGYPVGGIRRAS